MSSLLVLLPIICVACAQHSTRVSQIMSFRLGMLLVCDWCVTYFAMIHYLNFSNSFSSHDFLALASTCQYTSYTTDPSSFGFIWCLPICNTNTTKQTTSTPAKPTAPRVHWLSILKTKSPKPAAKYIRLLRGFSNNTFHAATWMLTPTPTVHMASYTIWLALPCRRKTVLHMSKGQPVLWVSPW